MKTILIFYFAIVSFFVANKFHSPQHTRDAVYRMVALKTKTYCDGFNDGYPSGYKDVKGKYAICPVTPVCPVPEVDKNTYQDGYNEGFKQGSKDAKE